VTRTGRPTTIRGGFTEQIKVRLSAKSAREIRRRARFAGITVAEYVRGVLDKAQSIEECG
jgi:predicted DNA binding CopG/RHH family protein